MSLSNEAKEALTNHYDELAEELYIFYRSLKLNGFDAGQSMDIMLALINNPASSMSKREAMEKNRRLIRDRLERLKRDQFQEEEMKKIVDAQHPKPDFTNHDGSHDYD